MDLSAIGNYLQSLSLPAFRQRQIVKNYFSGHYSNFSQMTDLPLALRTDLDSKYSLFSVKEENILTSTDSQKALLTLGDGQKIESVLMNYHDWLTVCVSTQVGCPLKCKFCATGKMGFKRNLAVEEIIDQILFWKSTLLSKGGKGGLNVNRIVFMGMGEPFLNWDNLLAALKIINEDLVIGARKISISTAGVAPRIIDFANLDTEINLAISLHSADQITREKMMPIARQYPLGELLKSLNYYTRTTRRQVFFEYLLAQDINDTPHHLDLLIDFITSNNLFYLNLIPLNPIKGGLIPSSKLKYFQQELTKNKVNFSTRRSLGQSIDSACGQLIVKK
ncbi:MAG TPA: 23S rRNA (adenine(2503)-C(2))-methyltransferase RlmN [Marinilabiliales bacterium]|nr:23S rRNA (adenine(2503)-C(2))-methyltransferase RlmN [Marinilabiliales bacterium]